MIRWILKIAFCVGIVAVAQAQPSPATYKLDAGDLFGGKKWVFKAGNDPRWARPDLNTADWQEHRPQDDISEHTALWKGGEGWFRVWVQANEDNVGKPFTLVVRQFGQSEFFLDGKPFATVKPARIDSGGSQRITRLVPFELNDTNRHLVAVHYKFRKHFVVYQNLSQHAMKIWTEEPDTAANFLDDPVDSGNRFLFAGIFGILSLLHLLFFRVNQNKTLNRTLALMSLGFGLNYILRPIQETTYSLTTASFLNLTSSLSNHLALGLMLLAVYQYTHRKLTYWFWVPIGLLALEFLYQTLIGTLPGWMNVIPECAVVVEYIRVSHLARKSGDPEQRLPWNSLRFSVMTFVALIVIAILMAIVASLLNTGYEYINYPSNILSSIMLLSVPVGLSLTMVREYAQTQKDLATKLREVEELSARTLAQEGEKQQILARQNEVLEQQVGERTAALNQSLDDLRTTQAQLVQREKLAALGELTAGIAHEIQNPLNFVNNFAEVSVELVDEIEEERKRSDADRDEGLIDELLTDLGQNTRKIGEHGKRASSIVRGMLQHSRSSSGQKGPTDLNALIDEYLKLAYHGLRAKDKSFNATFKTEYDPELPPVDIVPDEVGRVFLNLFNNAFYAVQQRGKAEPGHTPTVWVQTEQAGNRVRIRVRDNGTGMPDEVKQKIFQPFFTTKPTGEGTGLGLSLSYDIITKGHGGTLHVTSEPGEFTEFLIELPM